MKLTTKDALRAMFSTGPIVHEVALPNGDIGYVREMSAHERTQFEYTLDEKRGGTQRVREVLVVMCACDDLGSRLFTDDDVALVGSLPSGFVEPYFLRACEVNGMTAVSPEEVKKN